MAIITSPFAEGIYNWSFFIISLLFSSEYSMPGNHLISSTVNQSWTTVQALILRGNSLNLKGLETKSTKLTQIIPWLPAIFINPTDNGRNCFHIPISKAGIPFFAMDNKTTLVSLINVTLSNTSSSRILVCNQE